MPFDDIRKCAFRVLVYRDRIAVEFFHALTDGTGGTIFLKTLLAEYLCRRYGVEIPATDGVLRRLTRPVRRSWRTASRSTRAGWRQAAKRRQLIT